MLYPVEERRVILLDHLVDMDLPLDPEIPRIKKRALNRQGVQGEPSSLCASHRSSPEINLGSQVSSETEALQEGNTISFPH